MTLYGHCGRHFCLFYAFTPALSAPAVLASDPRKYWSSNIIYLPQNPPAIPTFPGL